MQKSQGALLRSLKVLGLNLIIAWATWRLKTHNDAAERLLGLVEWAKGQRRRLR